MGASAPCSFQSFVSGLRNDNLERGDCMGLLLLIILVLLLLGGLPTWPYSRNWGYGPTGGLGLILLIVLVLVLLERIPFGFY